MYQWEYCISEGAFRTGNEPKLGNLHRIRVLMPSLTEEVDVDSEVNPDVPT